VKRNQWIRPILKKMIWGKKGVVSLYVGALSDKPCFTSERKKEKPIAVVGRSSFLVNAEGRKETPAIKGVTLTHQGDFWSEGRERTGGKNPNFQRGE